MNGKLTRYVVTGSLLLTACNPTSNTPPPPPDTSFPKTWTSHVLLGTLNAPTGFNPTLQPQVLQRYLAAAQELAGTPINVYVDFQEGQAAPNESLVVSQQGKIVAILDPGHFWTVQTQHLPSNGVQQLEYQLLYKGKTSTVKATHDPTRLLGAPVLQKVQIGLNALEVQWGAVPGALQYQVVIDQDANPENGVLFRKKVTGKTALQETLTTPLQYNTPYQVLVFAYRQPDQPFTSKPAAPFTPDVSLSSQTVQINKPVPTGKLAAFPSSLQAEVSLLQTKYVPILLKSGPSEVDTTYQLEVKEGIEFIHLDYNSGALKSNSSAEARMFVRCSEGEGLLKGTLTLTTNDPLHASEDIPVTVNCVLPAGSIQPYETIQPVKLVGTETARVSWDLRAGDAEVTRLSASVKNGGPYITLEEPGTRLLEDYELTTYHLNYSCNGESGDRAAELQVQTSDPKFPLLTLPLKLSCPKVPAVQSDWSHTGTKRLSGGVWNPDGNSIAFAPGQRCYQNCGDQNKVLITDQNLKPLVHLNAEFSPGSPMHWLNENTLVVFDSRTIQIWNVWQNTLIRHIDHDLGNTLVSQTPQGFTVAGRSQQNYEYLSLTRVYASDGTLLRTIPNSYLQSFAGRPEWLAGIRDAYDARTVDVYEANTGKLVKSFTSNDPNWSYAGTKRMLGVSSDSMHVMLYVESLGLQDNNTYDLFLVDLEASTFKRFKLPGHPQDATIKAQQLTVTLSNGSVLTYQLDGTLLSTQTANFPFNSRPLKWSWNKQRTRLLRTSLTPPNYEVSPLPCSPSNVVLLTGSNNEFISAVPEDECRSRLTFDGTRLVRYNQNHLFYYDLNGNLTGYQAHVDLFPEPTQRAIYDRHGLSAGASYWGKVFVYDHQQKGLISSFQAFNSNGFNDMIEGLQFSPDGKRLAVTNGDELRIFEVSTGNLLYSTSISRTWALDVWVSNTEVAYLYGSNLVLHNLSTNLHRTFPVWSGQLAIADNHLLVFSSSLQVIRLDNLSDHHIQELPSQSVGQVFVIPGTPYVMVPGEMYEVNGGMQLYDLPSGRRVTGFGPRVYHLSDVVSWQNALGETVLVTLDRENTLAMYHWK